MQATTTIPIENYILIDGSYFIYHRICSLTAWWKHAHPETPLVGETILENTVFMDKFESTFHDTLHNLAKNLGIESSQIIVARDCKRADIWRMELFPGYKGTRVRTPEQEAILRPLFQHVYARQMFQTARVLFHPRLEADDCIALSVKYLGNTDNKANIYIVASDKDYLQLTQDPRVKIFDLAFKNIALAKSSHDNGACDLFCKIVMGDTSDNISSVLKKCGPKTALKCWNDRAYFQDRLEKEGAQAKYELNQTLVDFKNIPALLAEEFYNDN